MTLANAHSLFCGLKAEPSFLANLTISDGDRAKLIKARTLIRAAIRNATKSLALRNDAWRDTQARQAFRMNATTIIKFMTQGSFAYQTLNAPAQVPKQEIDLDDGMYVPVRFLENGEPALAAKGLFAFVDSVLAPLCRQHQWTLDDQRDNCVRVELWPGAHIDMPIYSIPQDRFEALVEKAATETFHARDSVPQMLRLPSDKVMLARRDGTWLQSDPQQMQDWVNGRVERYGAAYRRICRFLKGWRDYVWEKPRLASICLMAAIDVALNKLPGLPGDSRDDELILQVAKLLPEILNGHVANPVIEGLCLNEWSATERSEIVREAERLKAGMISALDRTGDAEQVVRKLRGQFGQRLPYRPDAVTIAPQIGAIQSAKPARNPTPAVIPSTSG